MFRLARYVRDFNCVIASILYKQAIGTTKTTWHGIQVYRNNELWDSDVDDGDDMTTTATTTADIY